MSRGSNPVGRSAAKLAGIVAAMAAVVGAAPDAHAQFISRFALRGEGGVGTMLADHQRDVLGYDGLGIQGSVRLGLTIIDPLVLQVSLANWWFPSNATSATGESQTGRVLAPMGGLRIEPRLGSVGRLFLDGNVGLAFTGDDKRLTFDAGLGFEFAVTRWLGIGPAVRLGMVFQQTEVDGIPTNFPDANAMFWSGGLSITPSTSASTPRRATTPTPRAAAAPSPTPTATASMTTKTCA